MTTSVAGAGEGLTAEAVAGAYDPFHEPLLSAPFPFSPRARGAASANRDGAVFDDPGAFDIRRANATAHLSFGHGIHFCLGAALARVEARVTLELPCARLHSPRLVPDQEVRFVPNTSFRGPLGLEVEWDV